MEGKEFEPLAEAECYPSSYPKRTQWYRVAAAQGEVREEATTDELRQILRAWTTFFGVATV